MHLTDEQAERGYLVEVVDPKTGAWMRINHRLYRTMPEADKCMRSQCRQIGTIGKIVEFRRAEAEELEGMRK